MLCYAMLYYTIVSYYYTVLSYYYTTILYHTIPYYTKYILYYTMLYYNIIYYAMLYHTIPCHTIPYYDILDHAILFKEAPAAPSTWPRRAGSPDSSLSDSSRLYILYSIWHTACSITHIVYSM